MASKSIVYFGEAPIVMPMAGRWGSWVLLPGVASIGEDHWDALCASSGPGAIAFQAARSAGLLGPVESTPPPVVVTKQVLVSSESKEGRAALKSAVEALLEKQKAEEDEPIADIDIDVKSKRVARKG